MISVSIDPPPVNAAFRAGLGARWTFLSDPSRESRRGCDCARRPTRSTIPTCLPCSSSTPSCASTPLTTATGSGAGPPSTSWSATCASSRGDLRADWAGADAVSRCWLALIVEDPANGRRSPAASRGRQRRQAPAGRSPAGAGAPSRRAALCASTSGSSTATAPRRRSRLVLAPPGVRFHSTTARCSRRAARSSPGIPFPDAVSTLLRDDSHFEGAITVAARRHSNRVARDDPFARIFPAQAAAVGPGILGSVPPADRPDDRAIRQRQPLAVGPVRLTTAGPVLPWKEEPVLAGFQLTPTATADKQRQPVARMADGSIRHRAAGSPVIARLLQSDTSSHGAVGRHILARTKAGLAPGIAHTCWSPGAQRVRAAPAPVRSEGAGSPAVRAIRHSGPLRR